jgi:hypothetical protein
MAERGERMMALKWPASGEKSRGRGGTFALSFSFGQGKGGVAGGSV